MSSNTVSVDVCIVGGGPTGLFAGLLLQRMGVTVCILDAKPRSLEVGRADALNARTQQYLEVASLLDQLLGVGIKCNTSSTFADGEFKSRENKWWVELEHTLHKNFLIIGQPVVEKLLLTEVSNLVRYGEKATTITEDDQVVEVLTDSGSKICCKYAIGADGAKSTIRAEIGASFTGTQPEMLWSVLDTFIDTDFPVCPEIIIFQLNAQSRVMYIPRERGMSRFYVLLEGEISQERAEESIRQHISPYKISFRKTEWFSTFNVKERIASQFVSKYGSGRIILAGDAAHITPVNGGQGLNTGMADAFNLAWRLGTILKNPHLRPDAARTILRNYDDERRSIVQDVIDVAAVLVRSARHQAKQYVGNIEKHAGYITGMGVTYRDSNSAFIERSEHGMWVAGNRCPDVVLRKMDGAKTRLYTEIGYGKYLVLFVGTEIVPDLGFQSFVVPYSIQPTTTEAQGLKPEHYINGRADEIKRYTADWAMEGESVVVLVRPDMHIAYVGRDIKGAQQYLSALYTA